MKKCLSYAIVFIGGLIIGTGILTVAFIMPWSDELDENLITSISRLEKMAFEVYMVGDFNSSIVALNELVRNLENYRSIVKIDEDVHNIVITDLGLTHARLFVVCYREGKMELAEQEYQKATILIGDKLGINSQSKLLEVIEKIDRSANSK